MSWKVNECKPLSSGTSSHNGVGGGGGGGGAGDGRGLGRRLAEAAPCRGKQPGESTVRGAESRLNLEETVLSVEILRGAHDWPESE
jgi:hypothetical protein